MHVDIRSVDLHRVSHYLAKYLTKELLMSAPKRTRRVTTSRGIRLGIKRAKDHKWTRLKVSLGVLLSMLAEVASDLAFSDEILESFVVKHAMQT